MSKKIYFTVINDLSTDQRMQRICSTLQNAGYNCILIGRKLASSTPLIDKNFVQKRIRCAFNKGKLFYFEYNLRLFFYLFFKKMDGLCSIDCDTAFAGFVLHKCKKIKWIFDAHEIFTDTPEVVNRKLVQKIWKFAEKIAFKNAQLNYTVGPALANYFQEKYSETVYAIRNIPNMKSILFTNNFNAKIIVYQGALNEGRGLERLIGLMPQINATLWLIGDGDIVHELKKMVEQNNLNHKIVFFGKLNSEQLMEKTLQASIGYNVSENAGLSYYLSLNNKFFDYINAEIPSVINHFPEYELLNTELKVGILANTQDEEIISALNSLLTDENAYLQFKSNCITAKEKISWEKESKKLVSLYQNLFFE